MWWKQEIITWALMLCSSSYQVCPVLSVFYQSIIVFVHVASLAARTMHCCKTHTVKDVGMHHKITQALTPVARVCKRACNKASRNQYTPGLQAIQAGLESIQLFQGMNRIDCRAWSSGPWSESAWRHLAKSATPADWFCSSLHTLERVQQWVRQFYIP